MEIVYRRGHANAAEVLADLSDPPTYTAVRGMLRLLSRRAISGTSRMDPATSIPTADPQRVSRSALEHLVSTFFDGSASSAAAAMVGMYEKELTEDDIDTLQRVLDRARGKGGAS